MRAATLLLLLATAGAGARAHDTDDGAAAHTPLALSNDTILVGNETLVVTNGTVTVGNDTFVLETDADGEPVVRKKRTFGDIVFRGLADVLGYNVQRKPAQAAVAFPPPLAPVPGIDVPLQAAPAPAPPPCGQPRAAPPPCRPPPPPPPPPKPRPRAPPPCPKPRAPPPKRPPPPPPPPPPCARPRANPSTPAPCTPPAPPPKDALETISSNLRFSFNINRGAPTAQAAPLADDLQQEEEAPIPIEPRAARLPATERRQPRVNAPAPADADYLAYDDDDDEESQQRVDVDDDYEDVQESRDKAVREFGSAVGKFWNKKRKPDRNADNPAHYRNVHFGDRKLAEQLRRRSDAQRNTQRPSAGDADGDGDDEYEATTTTEDPHRQLRPRVLPPTEQNPGQIDTVTVRVPPIYREKKPKKLNRGPDRDEPEDGDEEFGNSEDLDSEGENTVVSRQTEKPRRRRKQRRRTRAAQQKDDDVVDYDYFGKKIPLSEEAEKFYAELRVPEPTLDPDVERIEKASLKERERDFLDDHERLRDDGERLEDEDDGRDDAREKERLVDDAERADSSEREGEQQRADSSERSDQLSPQARISETGFQKRYLKSVDERHHDPRPKPRT